MTREEALEQEETMLAAVEKGDAMRELLEKRIGLTPGQIHTIMSRRI